MDQDTQPMHPPPLAVPPTPPTFADNLTKLYRMASVWVVAIFTTVAGIYLTLPTETQQVVLALLPVPPYLVPILLGLLPMLIARAVPQKYLAQQSPTTPKEPPQ